MAKQSRKNMGRRVADLRSDSTLDSYNITSQHPLFHLLFSQSIRSAHLVPSTTIRVWPRALKPFKHRTLPTQKLPFTGVPSQERGFLTWLAGNHPPATCCKQLDY